MKIRSLLLGSAALAGLSTAAYASDLGVISSFDAHDFYGGGGDFDSFLLGTTACSAAAMMPDGHFGHDPGGHLGSLGKTDQCETSVDTVLIGSIMGDLGIEGYGGDPGDIGLAYPEGNGFIGAPAAGHGPS